MKKETAPELCLDILVPGVAARISFPGYSLPDSALCKRARFADSSMAMYCAISPILSYFAECFRTHLLQLLRYLQLLVD